MSNYDFKPLNDKEFESLCSDALGVYLNVRFERFKPGRDAGVDGRFFTGDGDEIFLQCKHWISTPLSQLINKLKTEEKLKIDKLNPKKYFLAISHPLSRDDKRRIFSALAPHVQSESDIFGQEDLNDILSKHKDVELRHYKLWLHSAAVISNIMNYAIHGRSEFSLKEINRTSIKYVFTSSHKLAKEKLEKNGVVIITGEPGVGKTTLAEQLCLEYVVSGFSYLKISDDIREAEQVFNPGEKQIIYFDDFLGRNYLEALRGHEGNNITSFIKRVSSSENKRFILTSRSTILNQGKLLIDCFENNNIKRDEYELKVGSVCELDKAHILYNHIWHSGLKNEYIEQLYFKKRYRTVIQHRNFNPRLISYITDVSRLEHCSAEEYWSYVEKSLEKPSKIWENAFIAQQDDFGRALILLVVLNGKPISEKDLYDAYCTYISLPENRNFNGRQDYTSNMKILTGSFLARLIMPLESPEPPLINLFNPSIGDYVLGHYSSDYHTVSLGLLSLRTTKSLTTLKSFILNGSCSRSEALTICERILSYIVKNDFDKCSAEYVSSLCCIYKSLPYKLSRTRDVITVAANFIKNEDLKKEIDCALQVMEWTAAEGLITYIEAVEFLEKNIELIFDDEEIRAATSLLDSIPEDIGCVSEIRDEVDARVIGFFVADPSAFVDVKEAFSSRYCKDYDRVRSEVSSLIESALEDLGVKCGREALGKLLDCCDIETRFSDFCSDFDDNDDYRYGYISSPNISSLGSNDYRRHGKLSYTSDLDEVDDLFDRS